MRDFAPLWAKVDLPIFGVPDIYPQDRFTDFDAQYTSDDAYWGKDVPFGGPKTII